MPMSFAVLSVVQKQLRPKPSGLIDEHRYTLNITAANGKSSITAENAPLSGGPGVAIAPLQNGAVFCLEKISQRLPMAIPPDRLSPGLCLTLAAANGPQSLSAPGLMTTLTGPLMFEY